MTRQCGLRLGLSWDGTQQDNGCTNKRNHCRQWGRNFLHVLVLFDFQMWNVRLSEHLQPKNRGILAHIRARHLHFFESVTKTEYWTGKRA
jgi:hypothetical protein